MVELALSAGLFVLCWLAFLPFFYSFLSLDPSPLGAKWQEHVFLHLFLCVFLLPFVATVLFHFLGVFYCLL